MIMFRVKISPQVVVSVQSALPKIAIALVLVTFSYAIAGFLIDIMYVFVGLFSLVFSRFTVAGVSFVGGSAGAVTGYFDMLTKGPAISLGGATAGNITAGGVYIYKRIFWVFFFFFVYFFIVFFDLVFSGFC